MRLDRSPVESRVPAEPAFYTLYDVRCPANRTVNSRGDERPCGFLWYRREQCTDQAAHQIFCKMCGNLILYRLGEQVVEDRVPVVILSIHRPRRVNGVDT